MVLYVASDLVWATRIRGTLDALGIPSRPARTLEMLRARLGDSPVRALIVDLEHSEAIDFIREVRGPRAALGHDSPASQAGEPRETPIHIVAFGPHVETDRLRAAAEAGADEALARGAFDRRMPEILGRYR